MRVRRTSRSLNSNALVLFRGDRRRFNLYKFDLRIGVAEFGEFGLEQRVVARVVHQAEVVGKFGSKPIVSRFLSNETGLASTR